MTEEIDVVFKEPKTFTQTFNPIITFTWLMGTGPGILKDLKKMTILMKFIHFSICSSVVACGIIDFFFIGSVLKGEMFKILYYTNKAVTYVASYYYVSLSLVKYKTWRKFIGCIDSLDKKIRREIMVKNRGVKVLQIFALVGILAFGPISAFIHAAYYFYTDYHEIYASDMLLYYVITLSLTMNFWFDIIVCSVHQRFKIVNKLIKKIGNTYTAPWIVLKIQRLRELHHEICGLVRILNEIHGIHLLISSANSFVSVITTLFRIYIGVVQQEFRFIVANNVIWIVYATQFVLNCYVCTLTCREASSTGILIHEVELKYNQLSSKKLHNGNSRRSMSYQPEAKTYEGSCVQNEIGHFSSQLVQSRVSFNACGFFEIDNALLQGFIGVITTYLIILIQFYKPPEADNERNFPSTQIGNMSIANITEDYSIVGE